MGPGQRGLQQGTQSTVAEVLSGEPNSCQQEAFQGQAGRAVWTVGCFCVVAGHANPLVSGGVHLALSPGPGLALTLV